MQHLHSSSDGSPPRTALGRFFYAKEVPYGLAIVRMLLPLVLLFIVQKRWLHARELYSLDGAATPLADNFGYAGLLPELPGGVAVALMSALAFFLVASSVGWQTRISLGASCILYTYFNMMDSLSSITKFSVLSSHLLLLLACSHCGAIWSVDAWLNGTWRRNQSPGGPKVAWPAYHAWPRRLMQILFGVIYFGAAITKMHTPGYFTGEQLTFWMMTNIYYDNPLGEYLSLYPAFLVAFAYVAVIWEILFLFLAWRGWGRVCMLGLGVVFHLMTLLTLGLYVFPWICIASYFCFYNECDARRMGRFWRRTRRKFGFHRSQPARVSSEIGALSAAVLPKRATLEPISTPLFAFAVLFVCVGGVGVEHWIDPYGMRRPEGPFELAEVDAEYVARATQPPGRIRQVDKLLYFVVGTRTLGGFLANERHTYRQGESLIAQCVFNPPHEDMWVECNLHDAQNRVLDRTELIVGREANRCNFHYQLTDSLEPGEYFLVVMSAGQEIARRAITLNPAVKSAVAN